MGIYVHLLSQEHHLHTTPITDYIHVIVQTTTHAEAYKTYADRTRTNEIVTKHNHVSRIVLKK